MRNFTHLFLSVCAALVLAGCDNGKDDPTPASQAMTGNLVGFVSPVNEFGNPLPKSGVAVTLEGTTPQVTATTDANGRYEFTALRAGTYNIAFSRADVSPYKRLSIAHVGGEQPTFAYTSMLTQPSSTRISNLYVSQSYYGSGVVNLNFTIANSNMLPNNTSYVYNYLDYVVYVGTTPTVSSTTGIWYRNMRMGASISGSSSNSNVQLTRPDLNGHGLVSGSTAYVVLYPAPEAYLTTVDPATGRTSFSGLGQPSAVIPFVVP